MSFNIGLSGMRAASKDLSVTGNNIANAGTVGFKQSRAEFADVYASSILSSGTNYLGSRMQQGSGVLTSSVSQLFNQGSINGTNNAFDLAIDGSGFFEVSNKSNGALSYTRAGFFGTDRDGFIVDNFGNNLRGYTANAEGVLENGRLGNLQVRSDNLDPKATSRIEQSFNLNSTSHVPANAPFDANDPTTFNSSTSTNIYDAQGNAHVLTQFFVKTGANAWEMNVLIDGVNPEVPMVANPPGPDVMNKQPLSIQLNFDEAGKLQGPVSMPINDWVPVLIIPGTPPVAEPNNAEANPEMALDLRSITQFASTFAVNSVTQDGYATGELSSVEVDDTGVILSRYTNGKTRVQGQLVLADFANAQGLTPVGKTQWVQSQASGEPVRNPAGTGTLGAIQGGALEDSNVELSDQLVNLIVAQRNYQANAKTIETESAITQTLINLR